MAAKRRKKLSVWERETEDQKALERDVYAALWKDPEYVRLHTIYEQAIHERNQLDAHKHGWERSKYPGAWKADKNRLVVLKRIMKHLGRQVQNYENAAMKKAGVKVYARAQTPERKKVNPNWAAGGGTIKRKRISRNPMLRRLEK